MPACLIVLAGKMLFVGQIADCQSDQRSYDHTLGHSRSKQIVGKIGGDGNRLRPVDDHFERAADKKSTGNAHDHHAQKRLADWLICLIFFRHDF